MGPTSAPRIVEPSAWVINPSTLARTVSSPLPGPITSLAPLQGSMNRFDREHVDGIGDGLSIALKIIQSSLDLAEAGNRVTSALLLAREAKDRDNVARLKEMAPSEGAFP